MARDDTSTAATAVAPRLMVLAVIVAAILLSTAEADAARRDPRGLLTLLDTDGDGFVSKAELLAAPQINRTRSADDVRTRREAMFARLDANKDGRLSLEELSASRAVDGETAR